MHVELVFIIMLVSTGMAQCPSNCRCTKYKTFCKTATLSTLPSGLPKTTQFFKMEDDHIVQLNSSVVTNLGLSNLTCLQLVAVQLHEILPGTFQDMNLLESLTIIYNNISHLNSDAFKFLNNLYFLNLKNNHIHNLNPGSLTGLVNLRHLDLSWNKIQYLQTNIFRDMKNSSKCGLIKTPARFDLFPNDISYVEYGVFQYLCTFTHFSFLSASKNITNGAFLGLTRATKMSLQFSGVKKLHNIFNGLSELKELEIIKGEIEDIETGAFENLKVLKYLDLTFNKLSKLESGMFKGLTTLKVLILDGNNIATLDNSGFIYLESLKKLSMQLCNITTIELGAFSGLNQLQILGLYGNNIVSLRNNTFSKLTKLRQLNLDENRIKMVEKGAFPQLWSFNIFSQNISDRLEMISYNRLYYEIAAQKVTFEMEAGLGNIELRALVHSLQNFQELKSLHLYMNATSTDLRQQVYYILQNVHKITEITLTLTAMNSIKNLEELVTFPITKLYIEESNLLAFKFNSFPSLSKLKSLSVEKCGTLVIESNVFSQKVTINSNEHVFGSSPVLQSLEYLEIFNNDINALGTDLFLGLNNLKILKFQMNNVTSLSIGTFHGLRNIKEIHLSRNNLKRINSGVFGATCHQQFELSCKNASAASPYCNASNALKTLQYIDLSFNNITYIHPHAFISCTSLQKLDIFNNELLTLDNTFLFTPDLTSLDMSNCNVSIIPNNSFECTPTLSYMKLSIYKSTLQLTPLLPLRELRFIEVELNPFVPNCALKETWFWLQQRHVIFYISENSKYSNDRIIYLSKDYQINAYLSGLVCNNTIEYKQIPNIANSRSDFLFFKKYIEPFVFVIILILGLASNGFLLFISFRHSDLRTRENACLIHLAIVDLLSLIVNLPLSYWDVRHVTWELGKTMCKVFILLKDVMLGVNVYSVLVLNIERFLVARNFKKLKKLCNSNKRPLTWFIFMSWISPIVLSLPAYFSATVDTRCLYCPPGNEDYIKRVWTFQFIIHYFLPAVAISLLNIMTSRFLRESICNIPGVLKDNIRAKNRKTTANMVLILALVFVVSYLPNFTLRLLVAWSAVDIEDVFLVSFFSYCLFFCNTIFNPVSLFIMSSKYKLYTLKYFPFITNKDDAKYNSTPEQTCHKNQNVGTLQSRISRNDKTNNDDNEMSFITTNIDKSKIIQQARMERLAKLQERFIGKSNRFSDDATLLVPPREVQTKENNIQITASSAETEDDIKRIQAARMERLTKLQKRFVGKSYTSY